jgi:hypothetical protein
MEEEKDDVTEDKATFLDLLEGLEGARKFMCQFGIEDQVQRVAKNIYKWKPYATRPKGRPRLRWEDDARNDLRKMGVKTWKQRAQERKQWKEIIEQAKTHKEL